jgi:hypothetical protein
MGFKKIKGGEPKNMTGLAVTKTFTKCVASCIFVFRKKTNYIKSKRLADLPKFSEKKKESPRHCM